MGCGASRAVAAPPTPRGQPEPVLKTPPKAIGAVGTTVTGAHPIQSPAEPVTGSTAAPAAAETSPTGQVAAQRTPGSEQVAPNTPEEDPTTKPHVRLLYGSQSGTATRFCKQLAGQLRKKFGGSAVVEVVDLEGYDAEQRLKQETLVILCVATYGDGGPTDNAVQFFTWLDKEVEAVEAGNKPAALEGVAFAVFGLGNSSYDHYNAMGHKAHKALNVMGGRPVLRLGLGDDNFEREKGCISGDFDKWSVELCAALDAELDGSKQSRGSGDAPVEEPASYEVEVEGGQEDMPFPADGTGKDHHSPYWAAVTSARELHGAGSSRSCVHVELDITGAKVSYEAGDHVALHAANSTGVVEEVAGLLGLDLSRVVRVKAAKDTGLAPPPVGALSVRSLLAWHTDLLAPPGRDALGVLGCCAQDAVQAARLVRLASDEGKQEYTDWVAKPQRSLLEVLREHPSCRPPLGVLLASIAPRLQPRFYSISSSSKVHPGSVHVTCVWVRQETATGRMHEGIASTWLHTQLGGRTGEKVPIFIRPSTFKLPRDPLKPVVMVGPGTGLAPFRGFLQERAALLAAAAITTTTKQDSGATLGPAVLFFGCRSRATDYIYEEELAAHLKGGELSTLHVAFSRDGVQKDYVQHHIEREASEVWRLLDQEGGSLYVCGEAKRMAKDVHRMLLGVVQAGKGCGEEEAEAWVRQLQDAGRYQRDVW